MKTRYVWIVYETWHAHRDSPCPGHGERLVAACSSYKAAEFKKGNNKLRDIRREKLFTWR